MQCLQEPTASAETHEDQDICQNLCIATSVEGGDTTYEEIKMGSELRLDHCSADNRLLQCCKHQHHRHVGNRCHVFMKCAECQMRRLSHGREMSYAPKFFCHKPCRTPIPPDRDHLYSWRTEHRTNKANNAQI